MKPIVLSPDDFLDLATFQNKSAANALKSDLVSHGMKSRLNDERRLQRFWFMAAPKAGIHVQVQRKYYESARKILGEQSVSGASEAVKCPSCGSSRVQFPALTRKNVLPAFIGWMLAVMHIVKHKHYCEDCHYTWPQQRPDTQRRDVLGW